MEADLDKKFALAAARQAVLHFAAQAGLAAPPEAVEAAAAHGLRQAEVPLDGSADDFLDIDERQLRLELRHDCRYVGCAEEECGLCRQLLHRQCAGHIAPRSYVDAELRAKCERPVRVLAVDCVTGLPATRELLDVNLEVTIIDGARYEAELQRAGGGGLAHAQLEALMLLRTVKAVPEPLLVPESAGQHLANGRVVVPLQRQGTPLPGLRLKASSETVLNGKRSPFRLLVRALDPWGRPYPILPAVSDAFVVTTRRTRGDAKAEVPSLGDGVKVVENIGGQTVRKLADLPAALQAAGVEWAPPPGLARVETVGQLRQLIEATEARGDLQAGLQRALGLKRDQWAAMREHLGKAVASSPLLRAWFPPGWPLGLLFGPHNGESDAFNPWELLHRGEGAPPEAAARVDRRSLGRGDAKQAIRTMISLKQAALRAWWQPGHPGWTVGPWQAREDVPWAGGGPAAQPDEPAAAAAAAPQPAHKRDAGQMARLLSSQMRSYELPRKRQQPGAATAADAQHAAWPTAFAPAPPAGEEAAVAGWQDQAAAQPPASWQAAGRFFGGEQLELLPQDEEPPSAFSGAPSSGDPGTAGEVEQLPSAALQWRLNSDLLPLPTELEQQGRPAGAAGQAADYSAQLESVRSGLAQLGSGEEPGWRMALAQGGRPLGSFALPSLPQLDSLLAAALADGGGRSLAVDLLPPPGVSFPPRHTAGGGSGAGF